MRVGARGSIADDLPCLPHAGSHDSTLNPKPYTPKPCLTHDPPCLPHAGSHDSTIRLWDLRKGKTISTLTHHKKSVRGLVKHPTEWAFASAR